MRIDFLKFLRCPLTGEELKLEYKKIAKDGHVESGSLISSSKKYPIINGVPRFIFEKEKNEGQTIRVFGNQWKNTRDISLNYGQTEEYFSSYLFPLDPEYFRDKIILDAGCGNGRLVEYSLNFSPRVIIGLDYSESVELAFERTREKKNVLIIQGDIANPPLKSNIFEYIYSLGVIHHLKSPKKGIKKLSHLLNNNINSKIHIWIYSREGNRLYLIFYRLLKSLTLKMSEKKIWFLSKIIAIIITPYMWLCEKLEKKFTSIAIVPMQKYLSFLYKFGFDIYRLVIYDQLVPAIAFYPTKKEVFNWVKGSGLNVFHLDMRTNNSWRLGLKRNDE